MTAAPTLETERLMLRGFRDSDHADLCAVFGDVPGAKYIGGPLSVEDTWRRLAMIIGHWDLRGYGPFALEDKATGQFVGYCGPWFPFGFPEPEIGWGLSVAARGKGYVTEAARRSLRYVFDQLGWTTAISLIVAENTASIRVAERLGASLDGTAAIRGWTCGVWRHPSPADPLNANAGGAA